MGIIAALVMSAIGEIHYFINFSKQKGVADKLHINVGMNLWIANFQLE